MPINQVTCFVVACDGCGLDMEIDYIPHYDTKEEAAGSAADVDWVVWRDKVWCDNGRCLPDCTCGHGWHRHEGEDDVGDGVQVMPSDCADCECPGFTPALVGEEAPHAFEGVLLGTPDRDCTRCGRPDRDPIHARVAQEEAPSG